MGVFFSLSNTLQLLRVGFSLMNDIATELRSMSQATLDALMRISDFSGSLSDQDCDYLVEEFKNKRSREMTL